MRHRLSAKKADNFYDDNNLNELNNDNVLI